MALGGVNLPTITQRIAVDDSDLSTFGSRVGKIGKTLGTAVAAGAAVAAAGVGAFVASGVRGAVEVEKGIGEVVTLFGKTGAEAEKLGDRLSSGVAELSGQVGIAQDVLVGGLYDAISAGVPEENVFEFMRVASEASIAGVTDVGTAVDGLTTTVNAFGLTADDAQAVADSMFAAVQGGKTTFEELSGSLFQVAPAASAAGISFAEVNAGLATLTSQGTPTSVAATQMRAAIQELAKPGTAVGKVFEEVAGKSFRDFIAEGGNMTDALGLLQDHAEATGAKIGDYFGSVEAGAAATSIAATGADKMAAELERQAGASGAAGDAFETMNQTTSRALENLKVQLQNAAIAVGSEVLPKLNDLVRWASERLPGAIATVRQVITTMVQVFRDAAAAVGEVVAFIDRNWSTIRTTALAVGAVVAAVFGPGWAATMAAKVASTVAAKAATVKAWLVTQATAVKTAAVHSASVVRQVASWLVLGVQAMAQAARVAAAWLISIGPIALVIAAVVGLVALIVKNWDTIKRVIAAGWEWVKATTARVWAAITGGLSAAWAAITGGVSRAWDSIVGFVRAGWNRTRDLFNYLVDFVRGIPARILGALGNVGRMLFDAGKNIIGGLIDGIKSKVAALADTMKGVAKKVRDFLPFSPAKEGPLSGRGSPDRAGRTIGQMLADGLDRARSDVAASAHRMAAAASPAATAHLGVTGSRRGVGGGLGAGMTVHIERVEARDPHEAARELDRELGWQYRLAHGVGV